MPVPSDVLRADQATRREWFGRLVYRHPRMLSARAQLLAALGADVFDSDDDSERVRRTRLVALCGPTGVGKTTLMYSIKRELCSQCASLCEFQPHSGAMPVVSMECPSSRERGYDFNREHWISLLIALGDLFVDRHFDPDTAAKRRRAGSERPAIGRKSSGAELRCAAEAFMRMRRTRVLLLDEAHHMARVRGTRDLEEHLDELKSFGSTTGIRQVLFGTEQVKDLLRGNAQLARRTKEVFYDAYDYANPQDREAFNQIMGQLFTHLPLREMKTFESHFDYLFMCSAGCVGVLKDWLSDALELALRAGREHLEMSDLEGTAVSQGRLDEITEGIQVFREFARSSADWSAIRARLGMPAASASSKRRSRASASRQRRPGQRKPHRDPVPRETE